MPKENDGPLGELFIQTVAMPADTNPNGDIFGGWVLAQMDIAGGLAARHVAGGRVATIAVESMAFRRPVRVGDVVCCYAGLVRVGTTSLARKSGGAGKGGSVRVDLGGPRFLK